MKKLILITLLTFSISISFAQMTGSEVRTASEALNQMGDNEVRINVAYSIAGLPELNFERFMEDNMGLGFAAAASLEKVENMNSRWNLTPYYRLYFGNKKASGFFIEGNMTLWQQRQKGELYVWDSSGFSYKTVRYDKSFLNFGMGAALGVKLLARNGFVGEIYAGGGRLFGTLEKEVSSGEFAFANEGYFRLGICIGRRF